jgi:MFS family permease
MAAWALGLGGAGQVAGRLCYRPLAAHAGVRGRILAVMAAGALSTLLLALLPGPAVLLIAASVLAGTVRGLFTLVEATAVSDYWGPAGYASLNGMFSAPLTAATAIAPTIGAALAASVGGYPALFIILAGAGALSAALALAAKPPPQSRDQPGAGIPAARVSPSG